METSKEFLETILKKYDNENSISNVISSVSLSISSKGENYTSDIKRITIEVILKSGKKKKKSLILKELVSSQVSREFWSQVDLYPTEIAVYRDILPLMEDIMIEFDDYTEPVWGKCLDYRPFNRMIFEDLGMYGYKLCDRKKSLDFLHCSLVIRSLAKFHALSLILIERGLINLEMFKKYFFANKALRDIIEEGYTDAFNKLTAAMETVWEPEWKEHVDKVRSEIAPNFADKLISLLASDETRFNVLCYGDCWINNILFKYATDNVTPVSLKFVDFQITTYNSPALDLKYFLWSLPNIDIRNNSINTLTELYHESLMKELEFYNYKGKIMTLDYLNEELKRMDLFGLDLTLYFLPNKMIENVDEMLDMEDYLKFLNSPPEDNIKIEFNPYDGTSSTPEYREILKNTLKVYIDNHF